MTLMNLLSCILGPRLHRLHRRDNFEGRNYGPGTIESLADSVVKLFGLSWSVSIYTSPIIIALLYRKGYFGYGVSIEGLNFILRFSSTLGAVFLGAMCLRCLGRYTNPDYYAFISKYNDVKYMSGNDLKKNRHLLQQYDFDFSCWPIDYDAFNSQFKDNSKIPELLKYKPSDSRSVCGTLMKVPCDILSFIAVHTFGRRMIYPGSVQLLQNAIDPALRQGRNRLIETHRGQRYKVLTLDRNAIDVMFVDGRKGNSPNSKKLVITCEGNAGFYEIGTMSTPVAAGYSVLGWNTPGFVGSSGTPYPSQIINAIDSVIKFALDELGFRLEDTLIFAWSIGGFPATWAAMEYPEIKGLILDASFDDIVPLSVAKMPGSWKPMVINTMRNYFNLNNSKQLSHYSGPVLLIRRTKDEIIFTNESDPIKTNRANEILVKLLQTRFPRLMDDEDVMWALLDWLSGASDHQVSKMVQYNVSEDTCISLLKSYTEKEGHGYPLNIGEDMESDLKIQMILYLASKHFINYNSTHCTPLPTNMFIEPWNIVDFFGHSKSAKL